MLNTSVPAIAIATIIQVSSATMSKAFAAAVPPCEVAVEAATLERFPV